MQPQTDAGFAIAIVHIQYEVLVLAASNPMLTLKQIPASAGVACSPPEGLSLELSADGVD